MKKLISILLFSVIYFGTNALDQTAPTIWAHGIYNMNVKIKNDKTYYFVDDSITFTACSYHNIGKIRIMIKDDSPEGYEKVKQMMNEIQAKIIKVAPFPANNEFDKNGICCYSTKEKDEWNGYAGGLNFRLEDIKLIKFY